MRRLGNKGNDQQDTDIDITPMLDVVFIMLIFFIVTASFVKESGIEINKPPASNEPPDPNAPKPIVVEVNDRGEIRIQNRVITESSIRPTIVRLKAESPESSVVVRVEKEAKTRNIVAAIDGIRAANEPQPTVSIVGE